MNYFIYISHHFTSHGRYELNKLTSLPMCSVGSSVGRASQRYRGGHGFESRRSPDFFSGFFFLIAKIRKLTARITLHFHNCDNNFRLN